MGLGLLAEGEVNCREVALDNPPFMVLAEEQPLRRISVTMVTTMPKTGTDQRPIAGRRLIPHPLWIVIPIN